MLSNLIKKLNHVKAMKNSLIDRGPPSCCGSDEMESRRGKKINFRSSTTLADAANEKHNEWNDDDSGRGLCWQEKK